MTVHGLDHINIDTCRLEETVAFYTEVLGLESRPKPSGKAGVWLCSGSRAIVHVNVIHEDLAAHPTGSFNHVAFTANDVEALSERLTVAGREHQVSPRPDLGITQIFTTDPNGISVELNVPDEDT